MNFPEKDEYAGFYQSYLNNLKPIDFRIQFAEISDEITNFLSPIIEEKSLFRYLPEKWSIKEVVSHLIEVERIFSYRALTFSRNDETEIPGFEENDYVRNGFADQIPFINLIEEYNAARKSTLLMLQNMPEEFLTRTGIANKNKMSVSAVFHVIGGHQIHHFNIIRDRYFI